MKTLLFTLVASPLTLAQANPAFPKPKEGPRLEEEFNSTTVRPEKVASFRAKAAELYRRSLALDEESSRVWTEAEKKKEVFNKTIRQATPIDRLPEEVPSAHPWISRYYLQRKEQLQRDQAAFAKEVREEKALKQKKDMELASVKAELEAAQTPTPPEGSTEMVGKEAPGPAPKPAPVAKPLPSSVPGWPAGVEPAKKKQAALPPGVTKGK